MRGRRAGFAGGGGLKRPPLGGLLDATEIGVVESSGANAGIGRTPSTSTTCTDRYLTQTGVHLLSLSLKEKVEEETGQRTHFADRQAGPGSATLDLKLHTTNRLLNQSSLH